jgi:hypothetical protein
MAVRLSALRTSRTLLSRNIIHIYIYIYIYTIFLRNVTHKIMFLNMTFRIRLLINICLKFTGRLLGKPIQFLLFHITKIYFALMKVSVTWVDSVILWDDRWLTGNGLEGSIWGSNLKIYHLPGRPEENHEKRTVSTAGVLAKIPPQHLSNISLKRYRNTKLLVARVLARNREAQAHSH